MGGCRRPDWLWLLTFLLIRVLHSTRFVGSSLLNKFEDVSPLAAAVAPGLSPTAAPAGLEDDGLQIKDLRKIMDPSNITVGIRIRLQLQRLHTRLRVKAITGILVAIRVISEANKPELSFNHRRIVISHNGAAMPCMNPHPALRPKGEETRLFGRLREISGSLGYKARISPDGDVQLQSGSTPSVSIQPLFFSIAVLS